MLRVRRTSPEPRIELMPLIDVVFLLLTFFVFAMVLMVRTEVLDLNLPTMGTADPATEGTFITIGLDADGLIYVGTDEVSLETLADAVRARQAADPSAKLAIAADEESKSGDFMRIVDLVSKEELGPVAIFSRPGD